jgi:rhodanese-related sulfurtransferase
VVTVFGPSVPQVAPHDVDDGAWLLDVREPDEWRAGHIEGAHHIPMGQLPQRLDEVPTDATVVAVCRSGQRSAQVTMWLGQQGYEVVNLDGGMHAWAGAGRAMVADHDGEPHVA